MSLQSYELGFFLTKNKIIIIKIMPNKWRTISLIRGYTKFDFTVDEGKGRLNPSRDKN